MAMDTARSKLNFILGELAEKLDGSAMEEDDDLKQLGKDGTIMPPPDTPTKRATPRTPRKRRRKDVPFDNDFENTSRPRYMVTLFDRAVDLAQFDSETQLYEMSRAWMINRPNSSYSKWQGYGTLPTEFPPSEDRAAVHSLPAPTKSEYTGPRPLPPACKTERLEDVINKGTDMQELKKENMTRWQKVAGRWREASFRSQERHMASVQTLKSLFIQQAN